MSKSNRPFAIFAAIAVLFLVGCASTSMKPLAKDHPVDPSKAVVFWNLKLIDLTGTMSTDSGYNLPSILVRERHVETYGSARSVYPAAGTAGGPEWFTGDGFEAYDAMMMLSMDAGEFVMDIIRLYPGYDTSGNTYLTLPISRRFFAEPGTISCLGTLEVIITGKELTSYSFSTGHTREIDQAIIRRFTEEFPELASGFTTSPEVRPVDYFQEITFETSSGGLPEDLRYPNMTAYRKIDGDRNGDYRLERTEDDSYNYIALSEIVPLGRGDAWSVSWDGLWFSGDDTRPFGIIAGPDPDNGLFFAGSGNSQAAVFRLKNGTWTENPLGWTVLPTADVEDSPQSGSARRYRADIADNQVRFSVDGREIASFLWAYKTSETFIALYASGRQSVGFDDIVIEEYKER